MTKHIKQLSFLILGRLLIFPKQENDDSSGWWVGEEKKGFASLRLCVSSLHRDHANLLCIFKRLFNVAARRLDNHLEQNCIYKLYNMDQS